MLSMLLPLLLLLLGCSSDSTGNKVGYSAYFVILCLRPSNRLFIFLFIKTSAAKGGSHLYAGKISTMNIYA